VADIGSSKNALLELLGPSNTSVKNFLEPIKDFSEGESCWLAKVRQKDSASAGNGSNGIQPRQPRQNLSQIKKNLA